VSSLAAMMGRLQKGFEGVIEFSQMVDMTPSSPVFVAARNTGVAVDC